MERCPAGAPRNGSRAWRRDRTRDRAAGVASCSVMPRPVWWCTGPSNRFGASTDMAARSSYAWPCQKGLNERHHGGHDAIRRPGRFRRASGWPVQASHRDGADRRRLFARRRRSHHQRRKWRPERPCGAIDTASLDSPCAQGPAVACRFDAKTAVRLHHRGKAVRRTCAASNAREGRGRSAVVVMSLSFGTDDAGQARGRH